MNDIITQIQTWYHKQCDGEWEHQKGISIDTLDNPGWTVEIDLSPPNGDDERTIVDVQREDEHDWVNIQLLDGKYIGNGGPQNLNEILSVFVSTFIAPAEK